MQIIKRRFVGSLIYNIVNKKLKFLLFFDPEVSSWEFLKIEVDERKDSYKKMKDKLNDIFGKDNYRIMKNYHHYYEYYTYENNCYEVFLYIVKLKEKEIHLNEKFAWFTLEEAKKKIYNYDIKKILEKTKYHIENNKDISFY